MKRTLLILAVLLLAGCSMLNNTVILKQSPPDKNGIVNKAGVDKKLLFESMNNDYDFDSDARLFKLRNLSML